MKDTINSLVPVHDDRAPWLFTVGRETFLDLRSYPSRQTWRETRLLPLLKSRRSTRRWERFALTTAVVAALTFLIDLEAWATAVAGSTLAVAVFAYAYASLRHRSSKRSMLVASGGSQLHHEVQRLGRTLAAIHSLKEADLSDHNLVNADSVKQVDPIALEELAKTLLQLHFPKLTPDYIRSVRQDVEASWQQTTGLRIASD